MCLHHIDPTEEAKNLYILEFIDDDDDDDDGTGIEIVLETSATGKVNNTLSSMGSSIKRPSGIKQAKAQLKDDRAYSKSGSTMSDMVHSNEKMINTMEQRNNIFLRQAKVKEMKEIRETIMMYRSLGDDEQVQFYMEKLKQMHEGDKPTVVETPNGDFLLPSSSSVTMSNTPQQDGPQACMGSVGGSVCLPRWYCPYAFVAKVLLHVTSSWLTL